MPLHLLGKKSWHVYNADNVERVRRDEAEAKAREEEAEQRWQQEDAARRAALLRGETLPPIEERSPPGEEKRQRRPHENDAADRAPRKRRRLRGEDDTDRDIRHAREDVAAGDRARTSLTTASNRDDDAPLVDDAGHLQLIPAPAVDARRQADRSPSNEESGKRKRERRNDNIFGRQASTPWYASNKHADSDVATRVLADVQSKDVWGNEDPLRIERERNRISSNDPFAAMQSAQRQLKQSELDRQRWQRERQAELEDLNRAERHRKRREGRNRRHEDDDDLESFSLDARIRLERGRNDRDGRQRPKSRPRSRDHLHRRHRHHERSRSRDDERRRRHRRHSGEE